MLKKYVILILIIFQFTSVSGQKEAANWYFGKYAGLNFSTKTPLPLSGQMETREGCASISNRNGHLLFYTDGSTVYNRLDSIMPNGTELFGGNSSTQSAIVIPKPRSEFIYYVFTVHHAEKVFTAEKKEGLNYSIVDMSLDNGNGDIVTESKNTHLKTYDVNDPKQFDWKCSEKIAATTSADGKYFWVLTHFTDTFYAFKVDENGVSHEPVTTKTEEYIDIIEYNAPNSLYTNMSAVGYLKISPDGQKIAIVHSSTTKRLTSGKVYLYDFDSATGKVSNKAITLLNGKLPYGVEFSPKSSKVYVSTNDYFISKAGVEFTGSNLYQFDLKSANIPSTITEVHSSPKLGAGALQLAINGKIYRSKKNAVNDGTVISSLAAITKPELKGSSSAYNNDAVNLAGGTNSENGLPPFISSLFLLTFDYEYTCIGDQTHFFITNDDVYDTLIWDFGDGNTSAEVEPYHEYAAPGEYTVTLRTFYGPDENKPIKKSIEILEKMAVLQSPYEFIECDVAGDPKDGMTNFNLPMANQAISLGKENEVEIFYYKDLNTLENDILNENSLPDIYLSQEPNELIFAKVIRKFTTCYSVAQVILKGAKTIELNQETPLFGCNLGDGKAEFDLETKAHNIKNELNLPGHTEVSFHASEHFAALGHEALDGIFVSKPKKIFIRVSNENICYGLGEMDLEMPLITMLNLDETYERCLSEFPLKINAGIDDINERQNYEYEWLDGQKSYEIEIHQPGDYFVTITDKKSLCNSIKSVTINPVSQPIVKNIELQEYADLHTAIVHLENNGDFEYALNNEFGAYQSVPEFPDLAPGSYEIFIRDRRSCHTISKSFFIFGFLKYFTPDGDGEADVWEVKGLNPVDFDYSDIQIFNRYGKILAIIGPDEFWDGTYNGKFLPEDDYWFTVTVTDRDKVSTSYTKHFSLIRN